MPSLSPILRIRALSKSYTKGIYGHETTHTVLRNLNLDVYATERIVILAPPGSGKTTLLYCLASLLPPTSGSIHWDLPNPPTVAYVPEHAPYYSFLSLTETLEYYVTDDQLTPAQRTNRISHALDTVGLTLAQHTRVSDLSPYALLRLRLAQALMGSPQVILLDDLITHLDDSSLPQFHTILARLTKSGITILMTTHNPKTAAYLATRVVSLITQRHRSGAILPPHPLTSRISIPMS